MSKLLDIQHKIERQRQEVREVTGQTNEHFTAPAGLVDPSGQPIESDQHKLEHQQAAIRAAFARYVKQQNMQTAAMILARVTREEVNQRTNVGQLRTGATRMSFSLAFQIRQRFLITSRMPPAWVNNRHKPIGKRRRRDIIREFSERPDRIRHLAANAIIDDAEFSGSIVDSWAKTFQEAAEREKVAKALGVDAGDTNQRATATAEAHRARHVPRGDAPHEGPAT